MAVMATFKINALKGAFWIILLSMVFIGITLTADMFGFSIPIPSVQFQQMNYESDYLYFYTSTSNYYGRHVSVQNTNATHKRNLPSDGLQQESIPNGDDGSIVEEVPINRTKTTHIGFLKVHKAGSTTMQNMFFRFGLKHKLNIALPKSGNYLFSKGAALVPKGFKHYDIFACHTVYSKRLYDQLLPADSVKIGIIREPLDRMVSGAYYYRDVWGVGYLKHTPKADFIHNIVKHPELYDKAFFSRTRNSMGKDFGFPSGINASNKTKIKTLLETLNQQFALVLVTEQFEESLVLMRRLLNWSIADIIFIKTNSHQHNPTVLSKEELEKFKTTSFLDYAIYDFFLEEFKKKLTEQGKDLVDEVKFLKSVLSKVKDFCDNIKAGSNLLINKSKWDNEFYVTRGDCKWMNTKELPFITQLRKMYISGKQLSYEN